MDPETQPTQTPGAQSQNVGTPPEGTPTPPATSATPAENPPQKKQITLPSDAVAKIRSTERKKGEKRAMRELERKAKEAGFSSVDEMLEAAKLAKTPNAKPETKTEVPNEPPQSPPQQRTASPMSEFEAERARLLQQNKQAEHRIKAMKRENARLQAEISLRESAVRAGIIDVDYALHLLRKELRGKKVEDMQGFDEREFFKGLRKTAPMIFEAKTKPASTTPEPKEDTPTTPSAAPPTSGNPETKPKDARAMSKAEFDQKLREMGISNPSNSPSF